MRIFAALPLSSALCDFVHESGQLIKKQYHGIRLVKHTAMHITLYFFGEMLKERINILANLMEDRILKRPRFSIYLGNLNQFPPRGRPRVLFYDITEGKEEVCNIFSLFRGLIAENGWRVQVEERPFTPHITLARNKFEQIDLSSLKDIPAAAGSFEIDRLVLFQSILKPSGAEYVAIKEVVFDLI